MTVLIGVAFVLLPQGRLWNARLLPFYYLCIYLLAALGVVEIVPSAGRPLLGRAARPAAAAVLRRGARRRPARRSSAAVGMTLRDAAASAAHRRGRQRVPLAGPDRRATTTCRRRLGPVELPGYEGRSRTPTAAGTTSTTTSSQTMDGGRRGARLRPGHVGVRARARPLRHPDGADAAAVLDRRLHRLDGGPLLRVVGHHAVPLPQPVRAVRGARPGPSATCRTARSTSPGASSTSSCSGVRYYLTTSETGRRRRPTTTPTSPRWPARGPGRLRGGRPELVAPLENQPAVWTTSADGQGELAGAGGRLVPRRRTPTTCFLAADGPPEWQRVGRGRDRRTPCPLEPVDGDRTSRTATTASASTWTGRPARAGQGVLLPELGGVGAEGPYRVTPTSWSWSRPSTHVELHYGWTPVDLLAWLLTLLGIVGLVLLARRPPVEVPRRRPSRRPRRRPTSRRRTADLDDAERPSDRRPSARRAERRRPSGEPDEVPVGAAD